MSLGTSTPQAASGSIIDVRAWPGTRRRRPSWPVIRGSRRIPFIAVRRGVGVALERRHVVQAACALIEHLAVGDRPVAEGALEEDLLRAHLGSGSAQQPRQALGTALAVEPVRARATSWISRALGCAVTGGLHKAWTREPSRPPLSPDAADSSLGRTSARTTATAARLEDRAAGHVEPPTLSAGDRHHDVP